MINGVSSGSAAPRPELSGVRQQIFNLIDTNGSGSVDKNELVSLLGGNTSTLVESLFGIVDTDNNNLISQLEVDSGLAKLGQQMKQDSGVADASGAQPPLPPNKVSDATTVNMEDKAFGQQPAEMNQGSSTSALSGIQPPSGIEKIFDSADANKDGIVTSEELATVMGIRGDALEHLFVKIDTNGDGVISRAESESFRQQMTEPEQAKGVGNADAIGNSISKNWQSELLGALLKSFTSTAASSNKSTSLYA
jgi:Ca2+-binding EF-hand superfamily protein